MKHTWYMSIAYALGEKALSFDDIKPFRRSYRDTKEYRKYMRQHPNHHREMARLMLLQEQAVTEGTYNESLLQREVDVS